ncbi:hypothetical protein [Nocardia sp. A7]|uniref:hypothetical protein n=1 Tax=Nocardia sp. A7 TaxID=2789274 RepID=UPI00397B24D0
MSTEYDRTKTDTRTDDLEHGHRDEHDRFAAGEPGEHQVIDAELIDPDSGRDPKAAGTVDDDTHVVGGATEAEHETLSDHRHDNTGDRHDNTGGVHDNTDDVHGIDGDGHGIDGEHSPVAAHTSVKTDAEDDIVPLFDEQSLEQLRGRWRELQGAFVDDPRDAVSKADNLVGELIHELTSTYSERQKLIAGRWSEDPDTESLRRALRSYRAFFNQLLSPAA